jgi:hypothetical protein
MDKGGRNAFGFARGGVFAGVIFAFVKKRAFDVYDQVIAVFDERDNIGRDKILVIPPALHVFVEAYITRKV